MSTDICQKSKVLFLGNISPMDILKKVWRGEGGEKGWFIPPTQKKGEPCYGIRQFQENINAQVAHWKQKPHSGDTRL